MPEHREADVKVQKSKCRREDEERQKKQGYGGTHQRAAASRLCCSLTHETGCNRNTHTSDPKYTPLPSCPFTPDTNLYSLVIALRAPGGITLTLQRIPAFQLGSETTNYSALWSLLRLSKLLVKSVFLFFYGFDSSFASLAPPANKLKEKSLNYQLKKEKLYVFLTDHLY